MGESLKYTNFQNSKDIYKTSSDEYRSEIEFFEKTIQTKKIFSKEEIENINLRPDLSATEVLMGTHNILSEKLIPKPNFNYISLHRSPIYVPGKISNLIAEVMEALQSVESKSYKQKMETMLKHCKNLNNLSAETLLIKAKIIGNTR